MSKTKKLNKWEREKVAAYRKELKEKGILPADKKPLNRKKFINDACKEWDDRESLFVWEHYLIRAASWMCAHHEKQSLRLSLEAVGAAKVLKIAMRMRQLHKECKEQGKAEITYGDELEAIRNIMEA